MAKLGIMKNFIVIVLLAGLWSCRAGQPMSMTAGSDLTITKLSNHAYIHVTMMDIPNYGKFPCNGFIYLDAGEALVFDTPPDSLQSVILIEWIRKKLKARIKGLVINHFHNDCLGGIEAFHEAGIPSYGSNSTIELAKADGASPPKNGFETVLELRVGNRSSISRFFGAGHTKDNIISWFPKEKMMFGGCMIKSLKAGKGNLADADVKAWPKTVEKIKHQYPNVKIIVPGHGLHGDIELLNYTIALFSDL